MAMRLVVSFDGHFELSCKEYIFIFKKRMFKIVKGEDHGTNKIITITDGSDEEYEQAMEDILSFFNYMAWEHGIGFTYVSSYGAGLPDNIKLESIKVDVKDPVNHRGTLVILGYCPPVKNETQEVALGLYNEALVTENVFFRTINFWKILCIPPLGQKKSNPIEWINNNLARIHQQDNFKELIRGKKNIGKYIYDEYRNALHHIERKPTLYPTKLRDRLKVAIVSWVMRDLAGLYIREGLQLKNSSEKLEILSTIS